MRSSRKVVLLVRLIFWICHGFSGIVDGFITAPPFRTGNSLSGRKPSSRHPLSLMKGDNRRCQNCSSRRMIKATPLYASSPSTDDIDVDSKDPFAVLNLEPSPSLNKKEIKRAYKRMALKYHPDVVIDSNSSPEQKQIANDRFAKINWAYETLIGKNGENPHSASVSSTTVGGQGYTPPHRRKGRSYDYTYTRKSPTSTGRQSTDWRDYMPDGYAGKEEEEKYNTDGDSFSAIFSDLLTGAAAAGVGAAAGIAGSGGGSIFQDFIEFLEGSVDGYSSSDDDDQLRELLRTGSFEDVRNEMDDTDLVVQQLAAKEKALAAEIETLQNEIANTTPRFIEKYELREKWDEVQAREKVVSVYLNKARKRLLALQTRYKDLIVQDNNKDYESYSYAETTTSSRRNNRESSYTGTNSDKGATFNKQDQSSGATSSSFSSNGEGEDSWKRQGFGSYGQRGSSRRRRQSRSSTNTSNDTSKSSDDSSSFSSPRTTVTDQRQQQKTYTRRHTANSPVKSTLSSTSSPSPSEQPWKPPVPPHRRPSSSASQNDKRRLREIKVDEEFDKLKKDLGL